MRRIVVLLAVAALSACAGEAATPTSEAVTAGSTVEGVTAAPTAEVTAAATEELARLPAGTCCPGTTVEPGVYGVPPAFSVQFSLEVNAGWGVEREQGADDFHLIAGDLNSINHNVWWLSYFDMGPAGDPAAFMEAVRATPNLDAGEVVETMLAGAPALQLDASHQPSGEPGTAEREADSVSIQAVAELRPGTIWYTEAAAATLRLSTLQQDSGAIVVYLEAPTEEWDAFLAQAQPVLDSMTLLGG